MTERRDSPSSGRHAVGRALLVLALLGIAAVTLFPEQGIGGHHFRWKVNLDTKYLAEDFLNAILFIPFGVALQRMRRSLLAAIAVSAVTSTAIELSQLYLIPGRFSELQDILANTAGGLLGWLLATLATKGNGKGGR